MTERAKKAKQKARSKRDTAILEAIPATWLDSLLTGPDAVVAKSPYDCPDIERLLQAIRERVQTIMESRR